MSLNLAHPVGVVISAKEALLFVISKVRFNFGSNLESAK